MLMSAVLSPVSSELATVSRTIDGIGCEYLLTTVVCLTLRAFLFSIRTDAHVYGAFNFVYGIGASSKQT